ncbi:MAG TPA: mandelate racemase/muconate lactonizing enzyme family protein [Opitutaceae bacterium]|nr:mandelate racemase/muconate lactonizing enzyme family protein [Opitutaceae bacterium]HRJ47048.1 mandelate racemase/muconate lactonizing enzyme family protein [Opitutaceae bacterium]
MKIITLDTYLLNHPMTRPTGPSNFYYRTRTTLIIRIATDEGLVGWGETVALPGVKAIIDAHCAPLLCGRDPCDRRVLSRQLWGQSFGNGMAIGGVEIALDDLRGQILNMPIAELYGGRLRPRVQAYASAMNYIEGEDPAEYYPHEAEQLYAAGFRAMKMRLGGQPHARDLAAAKAVRRAVGPEVKLMADGNGAYALGGAIKMGRALEELDYYWWEEPLPQSAPDYAGYEKLVAALDIPIAACEGLTSRARFKEALGRGIMDIAQPDVALAGGIGEVLFIAEMARLWGVQCMPHCWAGGLVIAASTHLISLLPDASWGRSTEPPLLELDHVENPFRDDLLVEPLQISDGHVTVPTRPGLGVAVDEKKLKYYLEKWG